MYPLVLLQIVVVMLIDAIFLQPIKILIGLASRFLWWPSVKDTVVKEKCAEFAKNGVTLTENRVKDIVCSYDYTKIVNDGDAFKWLGLLYASISRNWTLLWTSTGYSVTPSRTFESIADYLKKLHTHIESYVGENGCIGRFPVGHPERHNTVAFSGDMLVGFNAWLYHYLAREGTSICPCFREKLRALYNTTAFSVKGPNGSKKRWMQFANAKWETHDVTPKEARGYVYSMFGFSGEMMRYITWLHLGYAVTNQKVYKYLALFARVIFAPMLILNPADVSIFPGRVCLVSWFTIHSNFCSALLYSKIFRSFSAKKAAAAVLERNKWNTGMVTMWYAMTGAPCSSKNKSKLLGFINLLSQKGSKPYSGNLKKFFSLKSFSTQVLAEEIPTPDQLGHKYAAENNQFKPQTCDEIRRERFRIESVICYANIY